MRLPIRRDLPTPSPRSPTDEQGNSTQADQRRESYRRPPELARETSVVLRRANQARDRRPDTEGFEFSGQRLIGHIPTPYGGRSARRPLAWGHECHRQRLRVRVDVLSDLVRRQDLDIGSEG